MRTHIKDTQSLCPECKQVIKAEVYAEDGKVWMEKTCPQHGTFKELYWGDYEQYKRALKYDYTGTPLDNPRTKTEKGCPYDCGICPNHKSHTVLAIIDVTNRCNLNCPICVEGSETILIKNSQVCKFTTLDEMIHTYAEAGEYHRLCENVDYVNVEKLGIKVPVLMEDGHIAWSNVKKICRKRSPGKLLKIVTETGRSITLTPDHKLLTWDGRRVVKVRADQLKPGDTILVAKRLNIGEYKEVTELDVLKLLRSAPSEELANVYVRGVKSYLRWIMESFKVETFADLAREAAVTWSYSWDTLDTMPLQVFYRLVDRFGIPDSVKRVMRLGVKGKKHEIPAVIEVDEPLVRFIALFVAEGNFNVVPREQYSIVITAKDAEHVADVLRRIKWMNPRIVRYDKYGVPEKTPQVVVSGKVLYLLLYYGLRLGARSSERRLPEFTLSLPKRLVGVLLGELISRDGYVARSSRRTVVGYRTTSKELMQQIQYLLATMGVYAHIKTTPAERHPAAEHDCYDLQVSSKPELEQLLNFLPKNSTVARKLEKLLPSRGRPTLKVWRDVVLDSVKYVAEEEHSGFVYDLEVDAATHNFIISTVVVSNCFAHAGAVGYVYEPSLEQIRDMMLNLRSNNPPVPALQLSGGEPTVREDLPEIVRMAKELGFRHVEVNSNGLKMAESVDYCRELREAGVDTIYLQFDGTKPKAYIAARGRNLFPVKLRALENLRKAGFKSVVLVPTLVRGVNDDQIGEIIEFAVKNRDIVRCVNFQPVSITGRINYEERQNMRITIPDLMHLCEEQTGGRIKASDWYPVPTVVPLSKLAEALLGRRFVEFSAHPHCGMATYIVVDENGDYKPITQMINVDAFLEAVNEAIELAEAGHRTKAKLKVATAALKHFPRGFLLRYLLPLLWTADYESLRQLHMRMIMIGSMHFQDLFNIDLDRIQRCIIHYATPDGRIIPFCTYNTIHRKPTELKFAISPEEWSKRRAKKKAEAAAPAS